MAGWPFLFYFYCVYSVGSVCLAAYASYAWRHASSAQLLHSLVQLLKSFCYGASRTAYVQTHEPFALLAKHGTLVEGQSSLVLNETHQLSVLQAELATVEPKQVACLWPHGMDLRHVTLAIVDDEVYVTFHIPEHLLAPRLAMGEGSHRSHRSEHRRLIQLISPQPAEEPLAEPLIRDDAP